MADGIKNVKKRGMDEISSNEDDSMNTDEHPSEIEAETSSRPAKRQRLGSCTIFLSLELVFIFLSR
jgi:hypothetical protein